MMSALPSSSKVLRMVWRRFWNALLMNQYATGKLPHDEAVRFDVLVGQQINRPIKPPFFYPFAFPANVLFAWLCALLGRSWGLHWQSAVALGGALAMSSTAIVVKLMAERLELESEHGRRVMGILLFQMVEIIERLLVPWSSNLDTSANEED